MKRGQHQTSKRKYFSLDAPSYNNKGSGRNTSGRGYVTLHRPGVRKEPTHTLVAPKPVNLPSLRSENAGLDPNVVLTKGSKWGGGLGEPTTENISNTKYASSHSGSKESYISSSTTKSPSKDDSPSPVWSTPSPAIDITSDKRRREDPFPTLDSRLSSSPSSGSTLSGSGGPGLGDRDRDRRDSPSYSNYRHNNYSHSRAEGDGHLRNNPRFGGFDTAIPIDFATARSQKKSKAGGSGKVEEPKKEETESSSTHNKIKFEPQIIQRKLDDGIGGNWAMDDDEDEVDYGELEQQLLSLQGSSGGNESDSATGNDNVNAQADSIRESPQNEMVGQSAGNEKGDNTTPSPGRGSESVQTSVEVAPEKKRPMTIEEEEEEERQYRLQQRELAAKRLEEKRREEEREEAARRERIAAKLAALDAKKKKAESTAQESSPSTKILTQDQVQIRQHPGRAPVSEAGATRQDSGTTRRDSGTIRRDSGTMRRDSGTMRRDSGTNRLDSDTHTPLPGPTPTSTSTISSLLGSGVERGGKSSDALYTPSLFGGRRAFNQTYSNPHHTHTHAAPRRIEGRSHGSIVEYVKKDGAVVENDSRPWRGSPSPSPSKIAPYPGQNLSRNYGLRTGANLQSWEIEKLERERELETRRAVTKALAQAEAKKAPSEKPRTVSSDNTNNNAMNKGKGSKGGNKTGGKRRKDGNRGGKVRAVYVPKEQVTESGSIVEATLTTTPPTTTPTGGVSANKTSGKGGKKKKNPRKKASKGSGGSNVMNRESEQSVETVSTPQVAWGKGREDTESKAPPVSLSAIMASEQAEAKKTSVMETGTGQQSQDHGNVKQRKENGKQDKGKQSSSAHERGAPTQRKSDNKNENSKSESRGNNRNENKSEKPVTTGVTTTDRSASPTTNKRGRKNKKKNKRVQEQKTVTTPTPTKTQPGQPSPKTTAKSTSTPTRGSPVTSSNQQTRNTPQTKYRGGTGPTSRGRNQKAPQWKEKKKSTTKPKETAKPHSTVDNTQSVASNTQESTPKNTPNPNTVATQIHSVGYQHSFPGMDSKVGATVNVNVDVGIVGVNQVDAMVTVPIHSGNTHTHSRSRVAQSRPPFNDHNSDTDSGTAGTTSAAAQSGGGGGLVDGGDKGSGVGKGDDILDVGARRVVGKSYHYNHPPAHYQETRFLENGAITVGNMRDVTHRGDGASIMGTGHSTSEWIRRDRVDTTNTSRPLTVGMGMGVGVEIGVVSSQTSTHPHANPSPITTYPPVPSRVSTTGATFFPGFPLEEINPLLEKRIQENYLLHRKNQISNTLNQPTSSSPPPNNQHLVSEPTKNHTAYTEKATAEAVVPPEPEKWLKGGGNNNTRGRGRSNRGRGRGRGGRNGRGGRGREKKESQGDRGDKELKDEEKNSNNNNNNNNNNTNNNAGGGNVPRDGNKGRKKKNSKHGGGGAGDVSTGPSGVGNIGGSPNANRYPPNPHNRNNYTHFPPQAHNSPPLFGPSHVVNSNFPSHNGRNSPLSQPPFSPYFQPPLHGNQLYHSSHSPVHFSGYGNLPRRVGGRKRGGLGPRGGGGFRKSGGSGSSEQTNASNIGTDPSRGSPKSTPKSVKSNNSKG